MRVELVTTLKRQATKILADLHISKEPVLITEHGQPSAYLVDVDDYEFMQQRMAILEGVARGEQAIKNGNTFSNQDAIQGVFGQANQGTFTRSVGTPLAQMTSQGYIPPVDPTNPTEQNDVNAIMAGTNDALQGYQQLQQGYGQPQRPPMGVQMPITPTYDLNAQ